MSYEFFFTWFPFAVAGLVMLVYVLPCRYSVRVQARWAMVLGAAAAKFVGFRLLGGNTFNPELPPAVIWAWNLGYSTLFLLALFGSTAFLARLALRAAKLRLPALRVTLPLVSFLLAAWGVWCGLKPPAVRRLELAYPDLPAALDGFTIAHLSDLHISSSARRCRTERLTAIVNSLRPDLIAITGDIVDGRPEERYRDVEPLGGLSAPKGVWACAGNHEFYGPFRQWRELYERWGVRCLSNECVKFGPLAVGGVDDQATMYGIGGMRLLPDEGKTFAAATNGEFRVLLKHRPAGVDRNVAEHGVRLQLSGHTHGGIGPGLRTFVAKINAGYVLGTYAFDSPRRAYLNVSAGSGQWAGFPVRILNDAEITLITLKRR